VTTEQWTMGGSSWTYDDELCRPWSLHWYEQVHVHQEHLKP